MRDYYLLRDGVCVPTDMMTWAQEFDFKSEERRIAQTQLEGVWISTVFLGLNHAYLPTQPPLLFETMVFCDEGVLPDWQNECERYSTLEEARAGHEAMVKRVLQAALDHATRTEASDDEPQCGEWQTQPGS